MDAANPKNKIKVSVCDWMILKRQKIGEFQLASQLGYDGVEVDMGSLGNREQFDNKLREEEFQKLFKEKAAEFGVEISSIAMSGFFGQSFAARDNYRALTEDCLNTMEAMGVNIAFLPLGTGCDLTKNPEVRPELVRRLKEVGDMAAARGMVIGIETSLDAAGEKALLKEIGSKGIKIYYKFQNALENNRDINSELKTLGRKRICQIHCTDTDGVTLRHNTRLDLPSVVKTLRRMHWSGWLVVERSRNKDDVRNVQANYGDNAAYIKEVIK
jgi:sugar phosphate isomerase/epimerase